MTQSNGGFNRRDVLKAAGVIGAGLLASQFPLGRVDAQDDKPKKVLMFTKSTGFEHPVVHREAPDKLSFSEQIVTDLGKRHNFEVTATKDGRIFTPEKMVEFDLFLFVTQGKPTEVGDKDMAPPMSEEGKAAFLQAIADGKGFLGLHCASDTFHSPPGGVDPYIAMLGGEFVTHGAQQDAHIIAADKDWGPLKGLEDFTKKEEWYQLKNFAPDMHVILVQDTQSMREQSYRNLKPYPETWARMHHKGRVFYSSMGHREDVWESDVFHKVLLGGLSWSLGRADAEMTPNLREAAPGAMDRVARTSA